LWQQIGWLFKILIIRQRLRRRELLRYKKSPGFIIFFKISAASKTSLAKKSLSLGKPKFFASSMVYFR